MLREKWITVEWTFTFGAKGTARFACRNGTGSDASVVVDGTKSGLNIPDQCDRVRPKCGIYRSVDGATSDIIDTHLLIQNYKAYKGTGAVPPPTGTRPATGGPTGTTTWQPAGRPLQATHPGRQVPHTISTARHPHRVRAAILGHGFHRHVHATPIIIIRDGNTGRMPELPRKT